MDTLKVGDAVRFTVPGLPDFNAIATKVYSRMVGERQHDLIDILYFDGTDVVRVESVSHFYDHTELKILPNPVKRRDPRIGLFIDLEATREAVCRKPGSFWRY